VLVQANSASEARRLADPTARLEAPQHRYDSTAPVQAEEAA
jgi:hypothetical protein